MLQYRTPRRIFVPTASAEYARKVVATESGDLLAYWPLWEAGGGVADNYEGTAARDGAYTGVTLGQTGIGDGRTCPSFDGINDYVDIYSVSLNANWDNAEGTIMTWMKVSGAGVWTDSTVRTAYGVRADTNNVIVIGRPSPNNRIELYYRAGGVWSALNIDGQSDTGWVQWALTWSKTADEVKAYKNGVQQGLTQTGLGNWVGALNATNCCVGAANQTVDRAWDGFAAHPAIWTTPLSAAQLLNLASV